MLLRPGVADIPGFSFGAVWVQGVVTDQEVVEFDVDAAHLAAVLESVAAAGISGGLSVSPPSLESLFLSHYSDSSGRVL